MHSLVAKSTKPVKGIGMSVIRMHWYRLGLVPGAAVLAWLVLDWNAMGCETGMNIGQRLKPL
jgi:hypothetical protein